MDKTIDINCDLGESFGRYLLGRDEDLMPLVSSCNIACGFHGGDPYTIRRTIDNALDSGVKIGAHPSFPDLQGFGRREMIIPNEELRDMIVYQIAALKGMTEVAGGTLHHVKPHGALYNMSARDQDIAECVAGAIAAIDPNLKVYATLGSEMAQAAIRQSLTVVYEAFSDRRYNSDLSLVSRSVQGSVLTSGREILKQVLQVVTDEKVETMSGDVVKIKADTICVHGDNPRVVEIVLELTSGLSEVGIKVG